MNIRWPRILSPTQLSQILRGQKNPIKALEIFNEAKCRYPGYRHNGPVYAAMIRILGSAGRLSEMKEVINQMKDDSCQCQDSFFAGIIKTYSRAGLFDEAISLFNSLREFNCVNFTESFNTLLEIMLKESKPEASYHVFLENFKGWEIKNRTRSLNLLISALCEMKRSDLALQILQEMRYQVCSPNRETYRILMRGLCEEGRVTEGTHLLYSMFWMISQKGCGADVAIYRTLLDTLCDNGEVQEAVKILDKILRKGLKAPKKHRNLDFSNIHDEDELDVRQVKCLINEALIKGGVPSADGYNAMAIDLYAEGRITEGDSVLQEMYLKGFRPSLQIFEAKVAALFTAGRVNEAIEVVEMEMTEKNCVPTVRLHNIVMKGLCNVSESLWALRYFEKASRKAGCAPDKEMYVNLVNGLCCDGKYMEASQMLEKMLINSFWPRDEVYNELIRGLCLIGKPYIAVMWLEEMLSQAKIPDIAAWCSLVSSVCYESHQSRVLYAILDE
ncbi:pentatricopeptide repeat-containing protein At1g05600 [Primulina tabacum]|uniref:pentatricopeptide repeat-containing protein At1g05600 n=1 Tax=Primulina tabacum TaxID=48773 RepID=UPI003F59A954